MVYHIRYGADAEYKAIRNAERAIVKEKTTRRILEAEWVSLNNPARLEKLSEIHLRLEPLAAIQIRTPDSFIISEEDMKIRGFGDILGFKQSGIKNFKLADPIHNNDLFLLAEKEMRRIEKSNEDISKFKPLVKLYDRADIINDLA